MVWFYIGVYLKLMQDVSALTRRGPQGNARPGKQAFGDNNHY
jgi:hypothetical protein